MKTKYIVNGPYVIAGFKYEAGEELKAEHESKIPNLLRLRHIEPAVGEELKQETKPAEKPAKSK